MKSNPDILVLDLDGTITKSDNLNRFSYYMIAVEKKIRFLLFIPLVILLKFKFINNVRFKILYSSLIIRNLNIHYLDRCADQFIASKSFQNDINQDVLTFIQNQNNSCKIILSANYSFLAEKIAALLKIETCLSVNLETSNGIYSGMISGQIPFGKEKITVFSNFINGKEYDKTIGIGDSKSDLPLLEHLEEGYLVSTNKKTNKTSFLKV